MSTEVIYQGQNKILDIYLYDSNDRPWDLTSKEVVAKYKSNGSNTTKNCSVIGNAVLGQIRLTLTDQETLLLATGDFPIVILVGTFTAEPTVDESTDTVEQIWQIERQITVKEQKT